MADERSSIIISIFSTTPGIGKTVTAINLAAGLANESYKVCLVDLDLQFGDVTSYLKLESKNTIAAAQRDYLAKPHTFNVMNYLTEYRNGSLNFSVMSKPHYVYDAYSIDVHAIEEIIGQLTYFDFVVLDLSSVFSSLNLAMLDMCTIVNFIGVIDFLPALKNFKIGYDTLIRFEYEESKIRLVENRADSQKLINSSDVERLLGEPFYHRLPNDFPSVTKSINEGQPLMFAAPNSRLTKSFFELTARYTSKQKSTNEIPTEIKSEGGFFSRLFGGLFH